MSIPVDVADLNTALADFGAGYLLSVSTAGRVKSVTVEPRVVDNVQANPQVTVLFPPLAPRGYTLLVDGEASVEGDDVRVAPAGAVLHRPAAHSDGPGPPDGCGHDCKPVT